MTDNRKKLFGNRRANVKSAWARSVVSRDALVRALSSVAAGVLFSSSPALAQQAPTGDNEEIIVTASRRDEVARNVAGGLQVYAGAELDRQGTDGFADYLGSVAGLSLREQGNGSQRIAVRGVSNMAGGDYVVGDPASTVGLYLNDIGLAGTSLLPDLQLYDLNRVEVLKGPQGTLYGEGAMGGAIKMLLNRPDSTRFLGSGVATLSGTEHGGTNYSAKGMLNIPLVADRVGLRVVGTYRKNSGFVDNIATGKNDHNDDRAWSGRAVLSAKFSDRFSAELLVLRDMLDQSEFPQVNANLPDLQIDVVEPRFNKSKTWIAGLTLNYDMEFATLTSVSSFFELDRTFLDTVPIIGPTLGAAGFPAGVYTKEPYQQRVVSRSYGQEVRLVSNGDEKFDWVLGGYYRKKTFASDSFVPINATDIAATNTILASIGYPTFSGARGYERLINDRYEHFAVYGEGVLELGSRVELTAGLRWSHDKIQDRETANGYGPLAPFSTPEVRRGITSNSLIPKIALKFKPNDDTTLYASAAKGFRSPLYNVQRSFGVGDDGAGPDNLWNYEVGVKARLADGRLSFDAAAFYIDWKDIQLTLSALSPLAGINVGFIENGGDARIKGLEAAIVANPFGGFSLGLNGSYMDARMVRGDLDVLSGRALPNAPKWTFSGNLEYRTPISDTLDAFLHFDAQYVDRQTTKAITTTNSGEPLKSYSIGNLRLGIETRNSWGVTLFVENLWDERAQYGVGLTSPNPTYNLDRYTIARPRTFGVSVRSSF